MWMAAAWRDEDTHGNLHQASPVMVHEKAAWICALPAKTLNPFGFGVFVGGIPLLSFA